MRVRSLMLLLVLLGIAPHASAQSPAAGDISSQAPTFLNGAVEMHGVGVLEVDGETLQSLRLDFSGVRGFVRAYGRQDVGPLQVGDENDVTERFAHGPGSIEFLRCEAGCLFVIRAEQTDGSVGLQGWANGRIQWAEEERSRWTLGDAENSGRAERHAVRANWFQAGTQVGAPDILRLDDATASTEGEVTLLAEGVLFRVRTATSTFDIDTTTTSRDEPLGRRIVRSFVHADLRDARLSHDESASIIWAAPSPIVQLHGRFGARDASGTIHWQDQHIAFRESVFQAVGAFELRPRLGHASVTTLEQGEELGMTFSGSAEQIRIGDHVMEDATRAAVRSPVIVATSVAVLAVLAYALAWSPLYTRIRRRDALENPNRARILSAIRVQPGMNVAEIGRGLQLARIVVRHHVRILEQQGIISARREGRAIRYFSPEQARMNPMQLRGTALDVARDVAANPATTQANIVSRLGISQRLASYHLHKLEEAGFASSAAGRVKTYAPTPQLLIHLTEAPRAGLLGGVQDGRPPSSFAS